MSNPGQSNAVAPRPVLATVLPSTAPGSSPLLSALPQLAADWEVHAVVISEPTGLDFANVRTLDGIGLPGPSLRFALELADLVSFVKPYFLLHLLEHARFSELLFVDPRVVVTQAPRFAALPADASLELFPLLPAELASSKPSLQAAVEAGLGKPAGDVIRIRSSAEVVSVVTQWITWIESTYSSDPVASLPQREVEFLAALPGTWPGVRWNHEAMYGLGLDLYAGGPVPPLVGTWGLPDVLGDPASPSVPRMERRAHEGSIPGPIRELLIEAIAESPPSLRYRSGPAPSPVARSILRAVDPWGRRWRDPFQDGDEDSFRAWLDRRDGRGLVRFAQALYWARPDLQRDFAARDTSVASFMAWLEQEGVAPVQPVVALEIPRFRHRIVAAAKRRIRRALGRSEPTLASQREPPQRPASGVNVIGYTRAETGLGEAARATMSALSASGFSYSVADVSDRIHSRLRATVTVPGTGAPYDVSVFHLNPPELLGYSADSLAFRLAASWQIGFFFWETDRVPPTWRGALEAMDEFWVASRFMERALRRETDKPISLMGLPVEAPAGAVRRRDRWGLSGDLFVVLLIADAYSGLDRKNPLGLVEAFALAFGPEYDGVSLVLKIGNLDAFPAMAARLLDTAASMPLTVISDYLDRDGIWDLLASCDVYGSLHKSEGFGLTILEAMALGLPVVVTDYGGSTDFADVETALIVDYELVPASGGPGGVYEGVGHWAEPDLEQAATYLRRLRDDAELRTRLGAAARDRAGRYARAAYQAKVSGRLRELGL